MRNITKGILFIIGIGLLIQTLTSCNSIKKLVDTKFPPLSYTEIQFAAISQSRINLNGLEPSFGVFIEKEFFVDNVEEYIQKEIAELESTDYEIKEQNINIELVSQGIKANIDFYIVLSETGVEIKGDLEGYFLINSKDENIIFSPAFKSINIKGLKLLKKSNIGKSSIAKIITTILNKYIDNINGAVNVKPYVVNIGWNKLYQIEIAKVLGDNKTEITSKPVSIFRRVERNSIRINSDGISLLGKFSSLPDSDVPENNFKIDSVISNSSNNYQSQFNEFNKLFETIWLNNFESINPTYKLIANISKKEISDLINEIFINEVNLKQSFEIPFEEFNENLEIKKENIDCSRVKTEFNYSEFNYSEFSYPEFDGGNCDRDCGRFDLHCKARVAACKVDRETRRIAYQAARETARIAYQAARETARVAHQAARETARIAHQAENKAKEAGCVAKRELTGFLDIGVFKGNLSGTSKCDVTVSSLNIDADLSKIDIKYKANIGVQLKSYMELKPQDLGYLFMCYSSFNLKPDCKVGIEVPENLSSIVINNFKEGENVRLSFKLNNLPFDAEIDNSPLYQLMMEPEFALKCPYLYNVLLVGSTATAISSLLKIINLKPELELLLLGKVKGNFDLDPIDILLEPIEFKMNQHEKIRSLIVWSDKSIKFECLKM